MCGSSGGAVHVNSGVEGSPPRRSSWFEGWEGSPPRFMLIAESGRVHLHGVVTRDVVHVNSGVRRVHLHGVVARDVRLSS